MMNKVDIELTSIRMVHDFLITKDFVVIPDLPLVFDTPKAIKTGKGALQFENEDPTRYGFLPKDGKSQDDIVWIDVAEPHVCYLFVNAWQEEDKVIIHGCIWDELDMEAVQHKEQPDHVAGKCCFKRLEFDLKTKECKTTRLIDDFVCDYPTINRNYVGKKNRYCYMMTRPNQGDSKMSKEEA
jgi:carotenoid cleavage dioxygenase